MKDRLHDTCGTKSRHYLETIGDKNFGELKGIPQIHQTILPPKFFTVRYHDDVLKGVSILLIKYHILPVNSHGYYKIVVEIGAATNQDLILK